MALALNAAMRLARSAAFLAAAWAASDGSSGESGDIGIPRRWWCPKKGRRKGEGNGPCARAAHFSSWMTICLPLRGALAGGWTGLRSALLSLPTAAGLAPPLLRPVRAFQKRVQKPARAALGVTASPVAPPADCLLRS